MSTLTRRTQILLDEERYAALERRASESGRSVGAVIREAIDVALATGAGAAHRRAAGRDLLAAAAPGYEREPDWADVKDDLRSRGLPA